MEFLKNFNGFEKLFQNTIDSVEAKMHDFGPERGHFGGQSSKKNFWDSRIFGLVKGIPPVGHTVAIFSICFFAKDSQFKTLFFQGSPVKKCWL